MRWKSYSGAFAAAEASAKAGRRSASASLGAARGRSGWPGRRCTRRRCENGHQRARRPAVHAAVGIAPVGRQHAQPMDAPGRRVDGPCGVDAARRRRRTIAVGVEATVLVDRPVVRHSAARRTGRSPAAAVSSTCDPGSRCPGASAERAQHAFQPECASPGSRVGWLEAAWRQLAVVRAQRTQHVAHGIRAQVDLAHVLEGEAGDRRFRRTASPQFASGAPRAPARRCRSDLQAKARLPKGSGQSRNSGKAFRTCSSAASG